jgi:tripartite-type tricarboxylate transporter receptor subunit TctC
MKRTAAVLSCALACAPLAQAQTYPAKPVRMVLALGGGAEVAARAIGDRLAASMGQPFLVEAQPGAGGAQGAETVARAAPDGYTIGLVTPNTHVYRPFIVKNMSYDPVKDFTPIGKITDTYSCLVSNQVLPITSFQEFLDYARKNPDRISYATTGVGTGHHLNGEQIMQRTGVKFVHVPYKGGNQQMQDLLGGQVPIASVIIGTVAPYLKQNAKLKVIAVFGPKRYRTMPDVPTVAEIVPGFDSLVGWMGFEGPANLPQPIVQRLNREVGVALSDAGLQAKLEGIGFVVDLGTPEGLADIIKRDLATAGRLAKTAGIQPE